jgi:hypothetical protein
MLLGVVVGLVLYGAHSAFVTADTRAEFLRIVARLAPKEDLTKLDDDRPLAPQLHPADGTSRRIAAALKSAHGLEIPDEDLKELLTIESAVEYLEPKLKVGTSGGIYSFAQGIEIPAKLVLRGSCFAADLARRDASPHSRGVSAGLGIAVGDAARPQHARRDHDRPACRECAAAGKVGD